ncbi:MAG: TIGR04283 family arsenosugar biosynthesis glycosyltransferase [Methylococcales bacterium]|nr:TIGR04283 family arsenosugar biosynthesis glycosyltransferase [Methylococcales bacterium]
MKRTPFSIIIPVLNEAASIQHCLLALQPLRDHAEIIVVDGGSRDNTIELAAAYADKILSSEQGRARQMNQGAKQATGDILLFLHADTELPEHALSLIEQVISIEQVWGHFDIQLRGESVMFTIIAFMMNWRSRLTGIATGDQVLFVSQTAFNTVGGYPDISLMEDIALSSVLKKISSPVCLTAKVNSSARRWQQYGIYKAILLMWSLRLRYWLGADPHYLAELYRTGLLWKR